MGTAGSSDPRLPAMSWGMLHLSREDKCFHYAQKQYLSGVMSLFLERDHMAGAVFSRGRSPVASALKHGASHIFTTALPATRPPLHSANPYIQKQLPASLAKAGITT